MLNTFNKSKGLIHYKIDPITGQMTTKFFNVNTFCNSSKKNKKNG